MKVEKIIIENFRLLKNLTINLEDEFTLIIGKNNTGKTSVLKVMDKFINDKPFYYDDFNNNLKSCIYKNMDNYEDLNKSCVSLSLFIKYDENDDLSNIRHLMQDLDPKNQYVILNFQYKMDELNNRNLNRDYQDYINMRELNNSNANFQKYLRRNYKRYFKRKTNSILYDVRKNEADWTTITSINLKQSELQQIINFKYVDAKRLVSNEDDRILSNLSYKYYENIKKEREASKGKENLDPEQSKKEDKILIKFEKQVSDTDESLTKIYGKLFETIIQKAKRFGGIKEGETILEILSEMQYESILSNNISIMYKDEEYNLPENYNGLGYLNLLSIIFEIESILLKFKNPSEHAGKPSDINLFFIEEPEAHTHPQMQYVFIRNIKKIIRESISNSSNEPILKLQTIMTSHSSHIVSGGDFYDIKYFQRKNTAFGSIIISKDLKELELVYKKEKNYPLYPDIKEGTETENIGSNHFKFLKQYLTLNKAEIFFADKVILVEGDTERILIPAMMKKIDDMCQNDKETKLLSQNISIIEVGAYSHIFEKFLSFIGIKTLIITDIDFAKEEEKVCKDDKTRKYLSSCPQHDATHTSNDSINHFLDAEFKKIDSNNYKNKIEFVIENYGKPLMIGNGDTNFDEKNGNLLLMWQNKEANNYGNEYHPSSFEDAFIHMNLDFVCENYRTFASLKPIITKNYLENYLENKNYKVKDIDCFEFANEMIKSNAKPSFAMDILLHSDNDFSNWEIPCYIKEGLQWLKKD